MTAWTVTSEKRHLHRILNRLFNSDSFLFHYGYPRTTSTNNKRHITATLHTDSAKINAAFVIFIYKQPVLIITSSCFILNHSSQIQQKITAAAPISQYKIHYSTPESPAASLPFIKRPFRNPDRCSARRR